VLLAGARVPLTGIPGVSAAAWDKSSSRKEYAPVVCPDPETVSVYEPTGKASTGSPEILKPSEPVKERPLTGATGPLRLQAKLSSLVRASKYSREAEARLKV
jgi:hypothetical protein